MWRLVWLLLNTGWGPRGLHYSQSLCSQRSGDPHPLQTLSLSIPAQPWAQGCPWEATVSASSIIQGHAPLFKV